MEELNIIRAAVSRRAAKMAIKPVQMNWDEHIKSCVL